MLDNITEYILEQDEINSLINELTIDPVGYGQGSIALDPGETKVAALVLAAAIGVAAYKGMKALAQATEHKRCRQYKLNSPAQKKCRNEVAIIALEKQITILKTKISLCKHSKDPSKCQGEIKKKIAKITQKIAEKRVRIKELESQV